ncbi:hypothetical protein SAMN05444149_1103 [Pseudosulfitobacter pseudonitzschiae]|nr:hypothetical protein SAMN05444149_1103 [Pseudosulfitobacter pseudonitzschiae]
MGTGRTDEFRRDAVRIALTSGLTRRQVYLRHGEDAPDLPQRAPALLAKITDNRGQVTG